MVGTIIFLVVAAVVLYLIVTHSATAEADIQTVDSDVKAEVTKVETDIKKL
jgi:hypothetical protein